MKNILLTGGLGYLGSHTAVALTQQGYRVILYDNMSNSTDSVLVNMAKIVGSEFVFIKGDIRDEDLLKATFGRYDVDAVFHFAGLKAVGESTVWPLQYYSNNTQGTLSLLQAMEAQQVKKLIFSSSATVYGLPNYLPIDENHPIGATNPYGRSKIHIEEILKDLADSDSSWRIACLRYFNPVGAHESGLIGDTPKGIPNNLMPYVAQVAAGQREFLTVYGNDYATIDGTGVRDYIHVTDLVEGHVAALRFIKQATGWYAFNLGAGEGYSVLELAKSFEKVAGNSIPLKIAARRKGDVDKCYANTVKAEKFLNWKAVHTLEEMCSSAWKFQKIINDF